MRFDGWAVAGEIVAHSRRRHGARRRHGHVRIVRWPGGEARLAIAHDVIVGRPHADAPPHFIALAGAGAKINKQHLWIAATAIGRADRPLPKATRCTSTVQALAPGREIEVALPAEISLSRGDLVLTVK